MNNEQPNNEYFITYSNSLNFEGILLAFRKKKLFDITGIPKYVPFNKNANCWLVNRKQLSISKAKELVKNHNVVIDVSELQWYQQENLNHVFNL